MSKLENLILQSLLRETRTLSIEGAFEKLLSKEINIPAGIRSQASTSQNHLTQLRQF